MRRLTTLFLAVAALALLVAPATAQLKRSYTAQLTGREEVPMRETRATGHVNFKLNKEGTELAYKLIASNIENVVAAHIHLGARGTNGGAVVTLYGPTDPGGGRKNGMLAEGTITSANLTGELAGRTLLDLIAAFDAGNAYVNVHTDDGQSGSGRAGDFPEGEIRGQIH
ncbi:MAG TPA: CHRD domain-containing protein [Candidatus Eisenbacteria bacterium]|nr:CHRD domain-containing protein [Candidatus Eisenbacteria bacterium]